LTTLFVGNLSPEATDSDLRTVFSPFGEIGSIKVARNRAGRARGFAFVELEEEAAAAAVEALKGAELKGRTMDVVVDRASSVGRHHRRDARRGGFRRRR
jgi:RNA recognition motif-containing protein